MLLEDVGKVKSKVNNTYEEKKTMKTKLVEKPEDDREGGKRDATSPAGSGSDPLYKRMIMRARAKYPYAQSDAHALARWFQDKEKEDQAATEFLKLELDDMQKQMDTMKKEINEIKRIIGEA